MVIWPLKLRIGFPVEVVEENRDLRLVRRFQMMKNGRLSSHYH